MSIYCTYLTIYSGSKLPPFYIGSSSVDKVKSGYHGSVKSRKYKSIYELELKQNPHLFKTKILRTFGIRTEATSSEYKLQKNLKVVKSSMYFNESLASPKGYFGRDVLGKNNNMYGKTHSIESIMKMSNNRIGKYSITVEHREKLNKSRKGIPWTEEQKEKLRVPKKTITCPKCNKIGSICNMKRYHFENCKVNV